MIKTPIQQVQEYVRNIRNSSKITDPSEYGRWLAMEHLLTALLPTEREVIEEAWYTGKEDGKDMGYHGRAEHTSAQHYFTTKFNTNDTTKS